MLAVCLPIAARVQSCARFEVEDRLGLRERLFMRSASLRHDDEYYDLGRYVINSTTLSVSTYAKNSICTGHVLLSCEKIMAILGFAP